MARRGSRIPVLILTARGNWQKRVEGIDAGADDYVGKPFQMAELLARLRALMRRSQGQAHVVLTAGPVRVDTRIRQASLDGRPIDLAPLEYRCLHYRLLNRHRHVSQVELTEQLWAQVLLDRRLMARRPLSIRVRFLLSRWPSSPWRWCSPRFSLPRYSLLISKGGLRLSFRATSTTLPPPSAFSRTDVSRAPTNVFDHRFSKAYGGLYWQIEDEVMYAQLRSDCYGMSRLHCRAAPGRQRCPSL